MFNHYGSILGFVSFLYSQALSSNHQEHTKHPLS